MKIAIDPYMFRALPFDDMVRGCPLMNPEFNGRPDRAAESEAAFGARWRSCCRCSSVRGSR